MDEVQRNWQKHGFVRENLSILIVHEFIPATGKTQKARENDNDWHNFTCLLTGGCIEAGQLYGPVSVPGGGKVPNHIPLYIGKIETPMNI
jgi:hypothetical protein